jgi:O-antigen/teichoic acid export membrane protein
MKFSRNALAFVARPAVVAAAMVMTIRVLTLGSRFALSLLLARMLTEAEVGQYGLLTGVLAFGMLAVGFEFYSFTMREMVAASGEERAQIIANQMFLALPAICMVACLVLLAALSGAMTFEFALWFIALLSVEHLSSEATRILIIMSRPIRAYLCVFVRGGIWVFAVAALMIADSSARTLTTVLGLWIIGGMMSVVIAALALRELPWRSLRTYRPNWRWIFNGLQVAHPFLATSLGALLLSYSDRFVIDAFVGRDALGIYTFYSTIIIGILSLGSSIAHQFLPKVIAARSAGELVFRAVLRRFFIVLFLVSGPIVLAAAVGMPLVLSWLEMSNYAAHITVFYILLPGALIRIIADVPSYALYAARADIKLLLGNMFAAVVAVIGNVVLVPIVGIAGAACASLVSSVILFSSLAILAHLNRAATLTQSSTGVADPGGRTLTELGP